MNAFELRTVISLVKCTKRSFCVGGSHLLQITTGTTKQLVNVNNPIFEYNLKSKEVTFTGTQYENGMAREVYGVLSFQ